MTLEHYKSQIIDLVNEYVEQYLKLPDPRTPFAAVNLSKVHFARYIDRSIKISQEAYQACHDKRDYNTAEAILKENNESMGFYRLS